MTKECFWKLPDLLLLPFGVGVRLGGGVFATLRPTDDQESLALYSFIVLLFTGVFLTLFFVPSSKEVIYHGKGHPRQGNRRKEDRRYHVPGEDNLPRGHQ